MSDGAGLCALAAQGLPGFAWLDGGDAPGARGLVGAWPDVEIVGEELALLDAVQARWQADPDVPWMGWLSYELGAADILGRPVPKSALPGLCLRRYPAALPIVDGNVLDETVRDGEGAALRSALREAAGDALAEPAWPLAALAPQIEAAEHRARVRAAQARIAAGDTYQVNLSQPMHAAWTEDARRQPLARRAADLYAGLRSRTPATMGGIMMTPVGIVVSNSPEILLQTEAGRGEDGGVLARSWPIKGTRPRGATAAADRALAAALCASDKDAAEHVMIVDLVRNDLGRLALPGSVRAPAKPSLMRLPTVHHLVTEVSATLRPDVGLQTLVRALFPGGSITGAPKRSTVEIIGALETHRRGIYCGCLVMLQRSGVTLSIAIRTALADEDGATLCSGGGIVIDSDPAAEWRETLDKAAAFTGPR